MQISRGGSLQSEINITPLVDVVLVLLIIFMVVVPLLMQGYDVGIPRVSVDAAPAKVEDLPLILAIGAKDCRIIDQPEGPGLPADCLVGLAGEMIPATELSGKVAEMLGGRPSEQHVLFLAADDGLNYEGVLRIVDLAKAGVEDLRIQFITAD
jgi:biopolymer transport protein ExbD